MRAIMAISEKRKKELNNARDKFVVTMLHQICIAKYGNINVEECLDKMWVTRYIFGVKSIIPFRMTVFTTITEMIYVARMAGIV